MVGTTRRLTAAQIDFVRRHVLDGKSLSDAFLEAFPELAANWTNVKSEHARRSMAAGRGSVILKIPYVAEYAAEVLAKIKRKAERGRFLSFEEKREFLAEVVHTPVEDVDESSRLAQEVTYTADGSKKIKMPDKHRAIEIDARLMGEFQDAVRLDISEKLVRLSADVV